MKAKQASRKLAEDMMKRIDFDSNEEVSEEEIRSYLQATSKSIPFEFRSIDPASVRSLTRERICCADLCGIR